jgi:hypothetical protein
VNDPTPIFASRGNEQVTASDPVAKLQDNTALPASDPKIAMKTNR